MTEPAHAPFPKRRSSVWRVSRARRAESKFFTEGCDVLVNPDAAARLSAIERWQRDRKPMRLAFWLEALFNADAKVRIAAAKEIGASRDVTALIPLMERAGDEADNAVRKGLLVAARTLLRIDDDKKRAEAVKELAKSRTDDALELIKDLGRDDSREVRKALAQMLYKLGDQPEVHKAYRELVDDDDDFIRILSALRWARVGSHTALERLVGHLDSKVRWDRERAMEALIKRTSDDFNYQPRSTPDSRRNQKAIQQFNDWLTQHPEAK